MNFLYRCITLALAVASFGFTGFAQNASPTTSGRWQGSLKVPGAPDITVYFDVTKDAKGSWIGSFSMPEIGVTDIPVDQLSVAEAKVHFVVPSVGAFDGALSSDGHELSGSFGDPKTKSPLAMKRTGPPQVKLPEPSTPLTKEAEGTWHGTLTSGNLKIRMQLKLTRASNGTGTGGLINVDQGTREATLTGVQQKDKSIDFEILPLAVRYHGTLEGSKITGQWTQMSRSAPLNFERGPFAPNSQLPKGYEGTWQANLDAGGEYKMLLALNLSAAADGSAVGTLKDNNPQSREMPVTPIVLKDKTLSVAVPGLNANFTGTINAAGTEVSGTWVIADTTLPLTFKHNVASGKK
jgi:hypothetical protein